MTIIYSGASLVVNAKGWGRWAGESISMSLRSRDLGVCAGHGVARRAQQHNNESELSRGRPGVSLFGMACGSHCQVSAHGRGIRGMVGTMTYVLPRRRDACYALGSWAEDRRGQERSLARSMVESWGILKIWLLNIPELGTDGSYLSNDLMCYSLAVGHAPQPLACGVLFTRCIM